MHRDNKNGDAFFEKNQIYSNLALSKFFICNRLEPIQLLRNLIMKFYRAYHHHLT